MVVPALAALLAVAPGERLRNDGPARAAWREESEDVLASGALQAHSPALGSDLEHMITENFVFHVRPRTLQSRWRENSPALSAVLLGSVLEE